jgi:hypothetical protein
MKYKDEPKDSTPAEDQGHAGPIVDRTPVEAEAAIKNHLKEHAKEIHDRLEEKRNGLPDKRPIFSLREARIRFDEYIQKVDDMFAKAKGMVVTNDATNVDATELGTSAMTLHKKISATKNQVLYYMEAKEYVSAVDEFAAMLTEKLYSPKKGIETIVSITKAKIAQYSAVLESQRREQEKLEQDARDELQKKLDDKAKETGTIAPKVGGPLISSKRETTVRTPTGSAYAVHLWDFGVEKPQLPRELVQELISLAKTKAPITEGMIKELDALMPYIVILFEDTRLRKAVKDGVRNIQGIRIFEKIDTRFKT